MMVSLLTNDMLLNVWIEALPEDISMPAYAGSTTFYALVLVANGRLTAVLTRQLDTIVRDNFS